jgi:hypothetical protein
MSPKAAPEPWNSFLHDLDSRLDGETQLCCVGGFAITVQYGFRRPTSDIDLLSIAPMARLGKVLEIAGEGRELHRKYGVYIQMMGAIVTLPADYDQRFEELFAGQYKNIRLYGLDPYDLALSKLERNGDSDREDVRYLFKSASLDMDRLEDRYRTEQRPNLAHEARHDLTIALWREMIEEQGY